VLGALVVGLALAIAVPIATTLIVAKAHRPEAGARVMGPLVMLLAVGAGVMIAPISRVAAAVVARLPRLPIAWFPIAVGLAAVVGLAFARAKLYSAGFDNDALPMGAIAQVALLPLLTLLLAALAYGPLTGLRQRVPARAGLVAGGLAVALGLGLVTLRGQPSAGVARAVTEHGLASRTFVTVLQSLSDRDGDGFSAFFRGPDCDDRDAAVNPSAKEIAGNGKDDNCQGGDRAAATPDATATGPTPTAPAPDAGVPPRRRPRPGRGPTCSSSWSTPCASIAWASRATGATARRCRRGWTPSSARPPGSSAPTPRPTTPRARCRASWPRAIRRWSRSTS
jgi:hypothetical protein